MNPNHFIITTRSDYQKLWYKILSQMYKSNIKIWWRIWIEERTHISKDSLHEGLGWLRGWSLWGVKVLLYENDLPLDSIQVPVQGPEARPGAGGVGPATRHHFVNWLGCVLRTLQTVPLLDELNHLTIKIFVKLKLRGDRFVIRPSRSDGLNRGFWIRI